MTVAVSRFGDISEVPEPVALRTASANLRSAFELSEMCARLARLPVTRGVQRFRSLYRDEMARDRDAAGRPRNARPRDVLGRPLPAGSLNAIVDEVLPDDPQELLRIGAEHFNAGRFFQAHEVWETAWHPSPEPERDFWQGITQIAVGFTHHGRGNATGAITLLRRGAARIEPYGESFHGVPCEALAARAREAADLIERDGTAANVQAPVLAVLPD